MRRVYKRNYISNFLIRLDLGTNLEEGKYDDILKLLTNDFTIKEKLDINLNEVEQKLYISYVDDSIDKYLEEEKGNAKSLS